MRRLVATFLGGLAGFVPGFAFILILIILIFALPGSKAKADAPTPRPRFELILEEESANIKFRVVHDKETGQEIICAKAVNIDGTGCWLTGRVWGVAKREENVVVPTKHAIP